MPRLCEVCGKSQYRKKVWETDGSMVICYECGATYFFDLNHEVRNKETGEKLTARKAPTDA